MMTQQLAVSILSAPLGAIDRRSLSQAWCSALRLAGAAPLQASASKRTPTPAAERGANDVPDDSESLPSARGARNAASAAPAGNERRSVIAGPIADRRAPRSALARRIEHAFIDPRAQAKRATFSAGSGRSRVHIVLQTSGARTRLIAFCRPEARPAVARALSQARYALALRNIAFDFETVDDASCS